jgi:hypothetical protein
LEHLEGEVLLTSRGGWREVHEATDGLALEQQMQMLQTLGWKTLTSWQKPPPLHQDKIASLE